jgi:hypothetical protein
MERKLSSDWRQIQLSKNFTLGECVVSKTRPDLAAKIIPTIEQANNLFLIVNLCAQPARDANGRLEVTSGLVSDELNEARVIPYGAKSIGDTQHKHGEALDLKPLDQSPLKVFLWIKEVLHWKGEIIYYEKRGHIHVGLWSMWVKHIDQIIVST